MRLAIGSVALGMAFCLPCMGGTYTGGECDASLLAHRWSFNGDYADSVGGATATAVGTVALDGRAVTTTGGSSGSGYVSLGAGLLPRDGGATTIEIWGTVHAHNQWSRVFDIGADRSNYLMLAWSYQTDVNKDRCEIKKGGTALMTVDNTLHGYTLGTEYHLSITVEPRSDGKSDLRWMRRDARTGEIIKQGSGTTSGTWSVADIAAGTFYLGHSFYYPDDLNANATYNEVRIWKTKLTDAQLAWSARLGADTLPTIPYTGDVTSSWTGAGGDNLWSTDANWAGASHPVVYAKVVFDGSTRTTNRNDSVSVLEKLTFGSAAAAHWLTGNEVELAVLENLSSATQTLDLPVTASTLDVTGSGTTVFTKQVASSTQNLAAGATVVFQGGLNVGSGTEVVNGGTVDLGGTSSAQSVSLRQGCTLNLRDGGMLKTSGIVDGTAASPSAFRVDGGTLVANGSGATLADFIGVADFTVGPMGMTFNTGNNTVVLSRTFAAGAVEGPIAKTGKGTLCMPAVGLGSLEVRQGTFAGVPMSVGAVGAGSVPSHLIHRWSFNGSLADSVGGLAATGVGISYLGNAVRTSGGGKSVSYVSINPNALPKDRPFTIEIFATPRSVYNWSRVFSFGKGAPNSDHKENFFMSWTRGTNKSQDQVRFRYNGGGDAIYADDTLQPFTLDTKWHIALTYVPNALGDGRGRFLWSKTDMSGGSHRESSAYTSMPVDLQTWGLDGFYLGRSYWTADLDASADYDELRIWDAALTSGQLIANAKLGPDVLPTGAAAGEIAAVEVASGAVFTTRGGSVSVGALGGSGKVSGEVTVVTMLDIAGEALGTMALDGRLTVKGGWTVDLDESGNCDQLTGTGTLDLSRATIALREPARFQGGSRQLAAVGEVVGVENARVANLPGSRLVADEGRLVLVHDGAYLILW